MEIESPDSENWHPINLLLFPESGGACDVGFQSGDVRLTSPVPDCTPEMRVEGVPYKNIYLCIIFF